MACLRPYCEPGSQVMTFALQALPLSRSGAQDKCGGLAAGGCAHVVLAGLMESPGFPLFTYGSPPGPGVWLA